ncbi:hypothetical protein M878_38955 [Streptomyces roseochromogenus subsp. oscitans DS 12.976]|uniref:Uncharacterized protein n=1 Tax=Streptomyces roseochromogenus subsp. oscitans DS 12.976 TaxID=1352936 RepID=V6JLH8_STRRC|nr:hypothetical protein M878_38955 [Streptomyces roseochromogenus subsp. oscitans DS 12.976]
MAFSRTLSSSGATTWSMAHARKEARPANSLWTSSVADGEGLISCRRPSCGSGSLWVRPAALSTARLCAMDCGPACSTWRAAPR